MSLVIAALVFAVLTPIAAGLITGPRWRRILGLAVAGVVLTLPYLLAASPMVRVGASLPCLIVGMRAWDLFWQKRPLPPLHRIWLMVAVFDTRDSKRVPRHFATRTLLEALGWAGSAAACLGLSLWVAPQLGGRPGVALRWLAFAGFVVSMFESGPRIIIFANALVGVRPPTLHKSPLRSRTVQEFWGVRWNQVVGAWLKRHFFMPMARRRRPRTGLAVSFVASAGLHLYVAKPGLEWGWAGLFALFFVVQILVIGAEQVLGVRGWSKPAGRMWTATVMIVCSPLFSEPMLQTFAPMAPELGLPSVTVEPAEVLP